MKSLSPNRAICEGDKDRAGVGNHADDSQYIRNRIKDWTTQFLKKFLMTCRSAVWRKEVHALLLQREGTQLDLLILNSKRARRRKRRCRG